MLSAAAVSDWAEELRQREFGRLDEAGETYVDYTGSALYGTSQLRAHHQLLECGIFGNPHSDSSPSRASTEALDAARERVLRFLGVDYATHEVCFTANTTAAIKLVAESYPFGSGGGLLLAADNHNSVNGIREFARRAGAAVHAIALDGELRLREADSAIDAAPGGLFALPAQSNFSGVRHPLSIVSRAKERGLDVLLDAAAFLPSHALDLRSVPADFVALSFYKLFGYPTGLGALVARRESLAKLRRPWFAGGTVLYASVAAGTHRLRRGHEGFEDGTPDFLSVAALDSGFALLESVGMARLSAHVKALTASFIERLAAQRHRNGRPLAKIYGPCGMDDRGGTVAFNLRHKDGGLVPYQEVERRARESRIALRGGCFCNPGAAEAALGLDGRVAQCLDTLGDGFNPERFAECLGAPVGAVRVSFGLANVERDIDRLIAMLASFA